MFSFLKKQTTSDINQDASSFDRLKTGLSKTRQRFGDGFSALIFGKKVIDQALLNLLKTKLITADVGTRLAQQILENLTRTIERKALKDPQALLIALKDELVAILKPCEGELDIASHEKPFSILMVGVNGAGKTTTIGKLACQFKAKGLSSLLAAGDTFRSAAVEQLQVWGNRNDIPVVAQQTGADSASVIFDAMQSAQAKGIDVMLADTAGRLHTQNKLMDELKKVKRVMGKAKANAPNAVWLVIDASIGQNAIRQAQEFANAVDLTGIVVTKLDGTAKGGVLLEIAQEFKLPIYFIGVGEGIEDLQPFSAQNYVNALLEFKE